MNFYEFIDDCRAEGLSADEALAEWECYAAERKQNFLDGYYSDPLVCCGMAQQDVIDTYRRER